MSDAMSEKDLNDKSAPAPAKPAAPAKPQARQTEPPEGFGPKPHVPEVNKNPSK
jgi:hypothetical protein